MNTINNKFSFSRFTAVLKCDLVEHRWRYISVFFIMFVAFLGCQLMHINEIIEWSYLRSVPSNQFMPRLAENCTAFFYVVSLFALICAAADMSSVPFNTKGRAMNYLMMPATKLEKFLSRAFINIVLVIVMAYVALFLADLARMLYVAISDIEGFYGFTVPTVWNELFEPLREVYKNGAVGYAIVDGEIIRPEWGMGMAIMAVATLVLSVFYFHSIILLGGCIWRKGALLKTLFVGFMIAMLFLWMIAHIMPSIEQWFVEVIEPWAERTFVSETVFVRFIFSIAIPLYLVLISLHWWLSYRLFSRKQAVAPQHRFGGKHLQQLLGKK